MGYFLGSIPTAYILGRLRGIDVRKHGSGNVGTMNTARILGWKEAVIVFIMDTGKGVVAVVLARYVGIDTGIAVVSAVAGHIFPLWLKGRGGKGLATALGCILAGGVFWPLPVFGLGWGIVYWRLKHSDLANLTGALAVLGITLVFFSFYQFWWLVFMSGLLVLSHVRSILNPVFAEDKRKR
ncbi:glycerol-3-phosphate acyltransferase [Thermosyntropha sp.]|uniref:glycerol-3-phosphate acyltransferase n=1 Tax=Thermosyntropha sp. TaxID=2740820 RepID=UPI0025DDC458|nr:glycerol-3-phosphate acyltransferase [Thermosyntropha sp.]